MGQIEDLMVWEPLWEAEYAPTPPKEPAEVRLLPVGNFPPVTRTGRMQQAWF